MPKKLPSLQYLQANYTYSPTTGLLKNKHGKTLKARNVHNYPVMVIPEYGMIYQHRVIWSLYYETEEVPEIIDHVSGDPSDNRITNLRAATHAENIRNQRRVKGVYWNKVIEKWQAQIKFGGKVRHIGRFDSFDDAVAAREEKELLLFGAFSRLFFDVMEIMEK